ncbi:MAG TPA: NAD-dependent epimerase/dehydratase family protein [Gemmatimonadales bacterium]|nr:NAD-dependent epimerase/dehydratase family protein [Gemmatimonadales bacterium]
MRPEEHQEPRRCLVTGGAGFIGSHVTARLVERGHTVRVVDDLSTGSESNLRPVATDIEFVRGDLCDPHVSRAAVDGIDVVFHLAALASVPASLVDPWACHAANVNGTMRLLEACAREKVQRIVYSSSSSVYGDTPAVAKTEAAEPEPRSPYAASKLAGEQYVLAFARAGVLEGVALRYFNVFGPRQTPGSAYAAVVPNFLQAALEQRPAEVYGDGRQTRDFIYVDNVVDANLLAAFRPASAVNGWVVNIGAGRRTSLLDLIHAISSVVGRSLDYDLQVTRAGDVRDSLASIERARRVLGFEARVSLEDGLRHTWNWLSEGAAFPARRQALPAEQPAA